MEGLLSTGPTPSTIILDWLPGGHVGCVQVRAGLPPGPAGCTLPPHTRQLVWGGKTNEDDFWRRGMKGVIAVLIYVVLYSLRIL